MGEYGDLDTFISEEDLREMQRQLEDYPDILPDPSLRQMAMSDPYGLFDVPQLNPQSPPESTFHPPGTDSIPYLKPSNPHAPDVPPEEISSAPVPPAVDNANNSEQDFEDQLFDNPEDTRLSMSTALGKLLAKERGTGEEMIQLPRSRMPSKIPKATRQAVTERRREKAARFNAALETIREKIDSEVAEVASSFDMDVEEVSRKLYHDTRWANKKRAPNIWNAVVHARSVLLRDGKRSL